jgi:hypothetical protein
MPIYFAVSVLCFSRAGHFAGAVVFEVPLLVEAKLKRALAGLPDGIDCEWLELAEGAEKQIPCSMVGRLLSLEELGQLEAGFTPKPARQAPLERTHG